MEIFARYRFGILFFFIVSCDNDFFPAGVYDYQVERLLSADGSKVWRQVITTDVCQDSIRLFVELIPSSADDSVALSEILRGVNCNPDTVFIGNADASSFEGAIVFTDSLNFKNGDFWILELITFTNLRINRQGEIVNYRF